MKYYLTLSDKIEKEVAYDYLVNAFYVMLGKREGSGKFKMPKPPLDYVKVVGSRGYFRARATK